MEIDRCLNHRCLENSERIEANGCTEFGDLKDCDCAIIAKCDDGLCQIDIALDDAIVMYASEFCNGKQIEATRKRISEAGGTLAYFASMKELIKKLAYKEIEEEEVEGPFIKAYICVSCEREITQKEKMDSLGACPICGHTTPGTVVETYEFSKKANPLR